MSVAASPEKRTGPWKVFGVGDGGVAEIFEWTVYVGDGALRGKRRRIRGRRPGRRLLPLSRARRMPSSAWPPTLYVGGVAAE